MTTLGITELFVDNKSAGHTTAKIPGNSFHNGSIFSIKNGLTGNAFFGYNQYLTSSIWSVKSYKTYVKVPP